MSPHTIIVILGPTASGKTALSITLAKKFGGVIISADSRQVYRGLDLGTGKVTKPEMAGVPHYLLDVASPRGQYSVSRYVDDFNRVLHRIDPAVPILLVGGSPFYIKGVTQPGSFSNVPPNPALRRRLDRIVIAQLIARLQALDPIRAKTIDQANRRRLIRAIEIAAAKKTQRPHAIPPMRVLKIGIHVPQSALYQKIDRRVDQRLRQGMIAEVRRLHRRGVSWKRLDAFGLEYRFISRYLRGQITKSGMVLQLKSAIHDFAKRQMTWWKREEGISWITNKAEPEKIVKKFLRPIPYVPLLS